MAMRHLVLVAALVLAASCSAASPSPSGSAKTVEITMSDLAFSPTTISLKAGETVTLRFRNTGKLEHEFMAGIGRSGSGFAKDWLAQAAVTKVAPHTHPGEEHTGMGVRVAPDWFGTVTVQPRETGEFEFGCFVPGHYDAGMKGKIVVR